MSENGTRTPLSIEADFTVPSGGVANRGHDATFNGSFLALPH